MSSLIPNYEYDIFISYRQKDNKGDRWVNKFVEALKTELEATFKEDVSVYFDENPHDRLQETHNVDKSLEGKLKCLIFIPILSQTYCDPNSYAWQYEFLTFLRIAGNDSFGKDVRLRSGNVASRILPIRIHDLEQEDIKLFEKETGSVLRAMDFVFKTLTGVIRPLLQNEDHPNDNLNKTFYRDQMSKVALAIKDIIAALRQHEQKPEVVQKEISKPVAITRKNNSTKIIVGSVILLALIILSYFLVPLFSKPKEQLEKSIAVLPFINDSPNDSTTYFINGIMEEVLNNLSKIKDFSRVLSRTSTDQYKGQNRPTIPEIGKKLGVNYIVEGSGQKYGNTIRLRVQLIAAKNERHLWAESYEQEIKGSKDIFKIQNQIAHAIASALKATITPEEKQLIEKTPTLNLTAYDFYQRGNEELWQYFLWGNINLLNRAREFFDKALKFDSTYARAYAGLAGVFYGKHYNEYESYYSKNYLDSVLILANRALSYDDNLDEGYMYRAWYYYTKGKTEEAIKDYDNAIKYNPNNWKVYRGKGYYIYFADLNYADYVKGLEYLYKAARINHGREFPEILLNLGEVFTYFAGFPEKGEKYFLEAFKLNGDSSTYLSEMGSLEIQYGNFDIGIEKSRKAYVKDSSDWRLAEQYFCHGLYKESLKYYKRYIEKLKSIGQLPQGDQQYIAYSYWQNGYKKEAEYWFNEQKRLSLESVRLGRYYSSSVYLISSGYYDLASVYAFTGEKEKAYEILRRINRYSVFPKSMVDDIKKYNPLFNSIRNEPEFQQIAKDIEAKYQAEHERVRKWLEENKML